jgi:hypothetical protein
MCPDWESVQNENKHRMLRCHNIQSLQSAFEYALFKHKPYKLKNLYYSLAAYKEGIPFRDQLFTKAEQDYWRDNCWKVMTQHDFVLDIDNPKVENATEKESISMAFREAQRISLFLMGLNCPHYIRFSGRGFHIFIPYKKLMEGYSMIDFNPNSLSCIYLEHERIAKYFYEEFTQLIDLSIYDSRRIIKMPCSLMHYPDVTRICYPLTIKDISAAIFNCDDYEPHNFIALHPDFPENILDDQIICKEGDCKKLHEEIARFYNGKKGKCKK